LTDEDKDKKEMEEIDRIIKEKMMDEGNIKRNIKSG
jgi:hypothetical protein